MRKLLYLAIVLITVYLNLVYEWREGSYILTIEIVLPVILYVQAEIFMIRIKVYPQNDLQIAEEGQKIRIPFAVENYGVFRIPVLWIWIDRQKMVVHTLKQGKRKNLILEYQAETCGKKQIMVRKMMTTDAAGLFRIRCRKVQNIIAEVHIIPKVYPVSAQISKAVRLFVTEGEEYAKDRGGDDTSEIFDIHEYQPGDKISRIHWKLSARMGELYMKEFSFPIGASVVLLMDQREKELTEKTGSIFLSLAVSTGHALLEESCRFYAVWKEKNSQNFRRFLVKDEETFYNWLFALSSMEISQMDQLDEEMYRHEFFEIYIKAIKIGGDLSIQCGESDSMFFHENTFARELSMTVLEI